MDVQTLIGEVARRHNVLLDRCDPVFITITMNEVLLEEYVKTLRDAIARGERSSADAARRHLEELKQASSEILSRGADDAAESVRVAGMAVRRQLEGVLREALEASIASAKDAARDRRLSERAAFVAVAALAVMFALVGLLWRRWG